MMTLAASANVATHASEGRGGASGPLSRQNFPAIFFVFLISSSGASLLVFLARGRRPPVSPLHHPPLPPLCTHPSPLPSPPPPRSSTWNEKGGSGGGGEHATVVSINRDQTGASVSLTPERPPGRPRPPPPAPPPSSLHPPLPSFLPHHLAVFNIGEWR